MADYESTLVHITTFVNPHVFWLFAEDDAKKRMTLEHNLESYAAQPQAVIEEEQPLVGQPVLVKDSKWKRAVIKAVEDVYTCWLIDYGLVCDSDKVYKLPDQYNLIAEPPLAKQAALNGVVGVKQMLDVDIKSMETITFNAGTIRCTKDRIKAARCVFFCCKDEKHNIHIGEINILGPNGHLYDLTTALVKDGLVAENKELFNEALRKNTNVEDTNFLASVRFAAPCSNVMSRKHKETLKELTRMEQSQMESIGRGTSRDLHKQKVVTPGKMTTPEASGDKKKKAFVEQWVEKSKETVSCTRLNYESDEESSKDDDSSTKLSGDSQNLTEEKSTLNVSASGMDRLQKKYSIIKSRLSQMKRGRTEEDTTSLNNETVSRQSDISFEDSENQNLLNISTNITATSFSPAHNSSPISDASGSKGNRIVEMVKMMKNKKDITRSETDETNSVNQACSSISSTNFVSMLQQSMGSANNEFKKIDDSETMSVETTSDDVPINILKPNTPPLINWDDSPDEMKNCRKTKNAGRNLKDMAPSGMILPLKKSPPKQTQQRMFSASKPVSQKVNVSSSKHSKDMPVARESDSFNRIDAKSKAADFDVKKAACMLGCECVQCKGWATEDLYYGNNYADTKPKKQQKIFTKPTPLLKPEGKRDIIIKTETSITSKASGMEQAASVKILVHGIILPYSVTSVTAVAFHKNIHQALRFCDQVFSIQSYAWPTIIRGVNVCLVNGPRTGKTMAYLAPVCSLLLEKENRARELSSKSISPLTIILCPGTEVAEKIYTLTKKLFRHASNKPNCILAIPPFDKECLNQFQKQVDVLIVTPTILISLLQGRLITVKRLWHLIIENADNILQKFSKQVDSLLNLIESMLDHRTNYITVQTIFTAEHWNVQLENVMKKLNCTPTVCIGSYLEAALYGRVDIQMKFMESKRKMYELAELLKSTVKTCKAVVICSNDTEIEETKEFLSIGGIDVVYVYDTMDKYKITEMVLSWHNRMDAQYKVLMCTDEVYNRGLNMSDVVLVIHYSLPDTWSQFANRFSCLLDNYVSPLATEVPAKWVRCKVNIFIDETCTIQFPKLIQFLLRMGANLTTQFWDCYKKTVNSREEAKLASNIELCQNIQLFGKCVSDNRQLYETSRESNCVYSSLNCKKRHILSAERDYSNDLPKCGIVKFKVVRVEDVTSFTVRLLEHTDMKGNTRKLSYYEGLEEELEQAMLKQKVGIFDAKPGEWFVFNENHRYSRCEVQKVIQLENITEKASIVTVRLLETGEVKDVSTSSLFILPKKFQDIPAQGVDVYLANIVPPDSDDKWSSYSKAKVERILKEADCDKEGVYAEGQILLQLGNVLWLKHIVFREKLLTIDVIVLKLNLITALESEKLISRSEEQLRGLYSLCEQANIKLPDYNKLPVRFQIPDKGQQQVQPQWAFFEYSDCNEVFISNIVSPSLFYVRLAKFFDLLESLQKDIQEAVAKPFYPSDFKVEVGKYYLAKDVGGDEGYCRVKVTDIKENVARCFYVDYGDEENVNIADMKYLADELIMKLPFQMIECRLYGVAPPSDEEWDPIAIQILWDYVFQPDSDYFRTLFTTTCKEEVASTTGGKKCVVLLIDNFRKDKMILINKLLIDCGEAVTIEDEDLDVEFRVPEIYVERADSFDAEDFKEEDVTIEDVKRLASKYKVDENENIENKNSASTFDPNENECDDSNHSWDIEVNNAELFLKSLVGIKEHLPVVSEPYLPPMKALPAANYCTPFVEWYQTDTHIKMNILLPNVNEYTLHIARKIILRFEALYDEKKYCLNLHLFAEVERTFQHSSMGQYVKATLTKCTAGEWPRLTNSQERMRNIKYAVAHCVPPEKPKKKFLQLGPKDINEIEENFIMCGSDEDYSQSDAESLASN